jgi:clusterin-associated protein 1
MKKLYQADGYAVRELLKIVSMLYKAQSSSSSEYNESRTLYSGLDLSLSAKLQNLKSARELASEITESGAKLFDLLSREKDLKEARDHALAFLDNISRNLDSNAEQEYIRNSIRSIISGQTGSLSQMEKMLEELEKDEKALEAKIKKRSVELERAEKRMKSLQSVRPAYMDEYERLEQELEKLYELYVLKFRNLAYLEHDLEGYRAKEEEKAAIDGEKLDNERKIIQEREINQLRGDEEFDEGERIENQEMRFEAARPTEARNHNRRNYAQEDSDESDPIDDADEEEGSADSQDEEEEVEIDSESAENDF